MPEFPRIGLGCMRLSTERDRDEAKGLAVLHAAFDAGIRLLDSADAYCRDDTERGHNERLIARALATWSGDRSTVRMATKGGLTRPGGRWEADGRAKHLIGACENSCRALGIDRLHLYQLHAPDPRTPLATSVRALASLKRGGLIEAIGLCNVTVGQIEEARRIAEIDAIQVELSIWNDHHFLSGVAEYCVANRLHLLAHRPLGGPSRARKTSSDATLTAIAARHQATPFEIALAWLMDLSEWIVPIPGATRVERVRSIAAAGRIALTDEDRVELDRLQPAGRAFRDGVRQSPANVLPGPKGPGLREGAMAGPKGPGLREGVVAGPTGPGPGPREVVLVMGLPGAGKTTFAERLVEEGYQRLNRDEAGGTLTQLLPALDAALGAGASRIVLDNTYVSRKSRSEVIRAAAARGFPVRCVWLSTSIEDAQTNAVWRIVARYGRLPGERELKSLQKKDVAAFLPVVQFRYRRELEPPDISEGFSRIDVVRFERRIDPSFVNRAVIVSCDGVLLRSRSGLRMPLTPDDLEPLADRATILQRYHENGYRLAGISWQPEIAEGTQSVEGVRALIRRMSDLVGLEIDVEFCPHPAGSPSCWCRKPLPGLGVVLVDRHRLDPAQCLYVGSGPQDPGFARRLGFIYREMKEFFA
jgi:aryl-alcohol dehydrogenase-like predicted oxidoreductase/histidinol phosphatase-like enzyme